MPLRCLARLPGPEATHTAHLSKVSSVEALPGEVKVRARALLAAERIEGGETLPLSVAVFQLKARLSPQHGFPVQLYHFSAQWTERLGLR